MHQHHLVARENGKEAYLVFRIQDGRLDCRVVRICIRVGSEIGFHVIFHFFSSCCGRLGGPKLCVGTRVGCIWHPRSSRYCCSYLNFLLFSRRWRSRIHRRSSCTAVRGFEIEGDGTHHFAISFFTSSIQREVRVALVAVVNSTPVPTSAAYYCCVCLHFVRPTGNSPLVPLPGNSVVGTPAKGFDLAVWHAGRYKCEFKG